MLPGLVWILVFHVAPLVFGIAISFFDYRITTPPHFVGVDNYVSLAHNADFLRSLVITALYVAGTVVAVWIFSFVIALALNRTVRGAAVWRVLLFLPTVIPTITIALLWIPIFNQNGPLNALLGSVGLPSLAWITSPAVAPWAMIVLSWWQATSYYVFMFLSGLQGIPDDLFEASALDGASSWQTFVNIVVPAMRRTFGLVIVVSVLNALQTFIFQNVITGGGPAGSTELITLLIYNTGFGYLNMGLAAAMSVVLFVLTFVLAGAQILLLREKD